MLSKTELRMQLRHVPGDWSIEDEATMRTLLFCPMVLLSDRLFAFVPLASEPDITALLSDLPIALPRCLSDGKMEYHSISGNWREHVRKRDYGVFEPKDGEVVEPTETSVILVPGIAFTKEGYRLGRGKGFYDRYLERYPKAVTIGVCRSYQLLDALPTDAWDIPVRHVVAGGEFVR